MPDPLSYEVLHALAHPLRLSALVALEERERTPSELAEVLGITEPRLMQQLHVLDSAGLISSSQKTGRLRVRGQGWRVVADRLAQLEKAAGPPPPPLPPPAEEED